MVVNILIKTDVDIAVALIEKHGEPVSINRLSAELNIDYKSAYTIIKRFENENLVSLVKLGNAYNCILNKKVHPTIFEAEYTRRRKFLKKESLNVLYKKLNNLYFPFIALIFGSYAKGKKSKTSDIDLMVISEQNRDKDIQKTISLLPLNIHLISLSFEDFNSMAKTKEFNVVAEALSTNIILIGIEDYYRMLENVR